MKFLIVNNFQKESNANNLDLKTFIKTIKETIKKISSSTDTESEFYITKTKKDLEKFLIDPQANYLSNSSARNFDLIDVVLINGRVSPVPWSKQNQQVI